MSILVLGENGEWRKQTKEEVMEVSDIEGKFPCDKCWEAARDSGIYCWTLKPEAKAKLVRCSCGRVI